MASTTLGSLIGLGLGAFGSKPNVPQLTPIDPNAIQAQTVAGNIANFGDISKLATSVNQFNQQQLNALIDQALPGARQQIAGNISSQLRGEVPADVQSAILRGTANRAVAGGFAGSGFAGNLNARSLGLTSLGLINQGLSSAESWLSRATAPQMDASSMFFSPQQRLGFAQQQQGLQFQRDVMAAGVAAAPDPGMAALAQGFDSDISRIQNAALSMGGMAMGGMAMGGGMGGSGMGMSGYGGFGSNFNNPNMLGGYGFGGTQRGSLY